MAENKVCIGEFMRNALALPDDEIENAMRSEDIDKSIDSIKIIAQPLEAYDRA